MHLRNWICKYQCALWLSRQFPKSLHRRPYFETRRARACTHHFRGTSPKPFKEFEILDDSVKGDITKGRAVVVFYYSNVDGSGSCSRLVYYLTWRYYAYGKFTNDNINVSSRAPLRVASFSPLPSLSLSTLPATHRHTTLLPSLARSLATMTSFPRNLEFLRTPLLRAT